MRGVVDDKLVLVYHEEGLPDWCFAVVGIGAAAGYDGREEGPGQAAVVGGVDVDFGLAKIGRDRDAGGEERSRREGSDCSWEDVEEGLVAETPVVYCVGYVGEGVPGNAGVEAAVDREVDEGWFGGVVLPGRGV